MPDNAPTLTNAPFGLPRALRELLRRDVALHLSQQRLSATLAEIEQEADTLHKTRPPFLFLHSKSTKATYNNQLLNTSESMVALGKGLEKIERLLPVMHAWVEDEVETHLRNTDPAYLRGLASHTFPEDWDRWIRRLDARGQRFGEFLRLLSGEFGKLPPMSMVADSAAAMNLLTRTAKVGAVLDSEVVFLNHVADTQRRLLGLGSETLPRQPLLVCEESIKRLRSFPAGQSMRILAEFLTSHTMQLKQLRNTIVNERSLSIAPPGAPGGYVLAQWEAMRKLVRLDLDPATIEQLVADTEKLLEGHV